MREDAAGGDPTTNGTYGSHVPGSGYWERTYLTHIPSVVRNKRLDRYRTHLRTSSEEYGNYWARSVTPQGSRFKYTKAEPIFKHDQAPDMLKGPSRTGDHDRNRDYLEVESRASHADSLPPIKNADSYREREEQQDRDRARAMEGMPLVHLPDVKNIEIRLTMADSSIVTLQASPRPYQFYKQ